MHSSNAVVGFFKKAFLCTLLLCAVSMVQAATFVHQNSSRATIGFNRGWLYNNTDNASFSGKSYNDASWTAVCLPHSNINVKHMFLTGGSTSGSGAEWQFISWYRKHYTPPSQYSGLRFLLEFEGVGTVATVYVNGTQVGTHQGGYTPFTLDVTSQIVTGQDNVIAVQVDSRYANGIPPEGSGIDYCTFGGMVRNVRLIVVNPLYTDWNFVSMPNCSTAGCTPGGIVTSQVRVVNTSASQKSFTAVTSVVDGSNNVVATGTGSGTVAANGTAVITYKTSSAVTHFWSPDDPFLYTVYTQLQDGSTWVDELNDRTGFRSIYFGNTSSNGKFYINGTALKLRGVNRHETFPYIGRAAAARLQRKDADILKYDLGCNLVRCSHYTQAPDFIKRCDEIGLMLIQEVPGWSYIGSSSWTALLMQDLKEMIYRDRNRPSVISFGVRVNESADNDALYKPMNGHGPEARSLAADPRRPPQQRRHRQLLGGHLDAQLCRCDLLRAVSVHHDRERRTQSQPAGALLGQRQPADDPGRRAHHRTEHLLRQPVYCRETGLVRLRLQLAPRQRHHERGARPPVQDRPLPFPPRHRHHLPYPQDLRVFFPVAARSDALRPHGLHRERLVVLLREDGQHFYQLRQRRVLREQCVAGKKEGDERTQPPPPRGAVRPAHLSGGHAAGGGVHRRRPAGDPFGHHAERAGAPRTHSRYERHL